MPQKRSLRQIERQQQKRGEGERVKQSKARIEKTIGSLDIPDLKSEGIMEQLGQMKAITPTAIASQFNIKVSMAKRILEELRRNEIVDLATRSHNLKVYQLRSAVS